MKHIIIGDGLSAYVVAACLDYRNEEFVIYNSGKLTTLPPILLLKYKNTEELKRYFKIFKIDYTNHNVSKYTKKINVGYSYRGVIYNTITDEMRTEYLAKQNRTGVNSSMSDNLNSFNAILLDKVFEKLKSYYSADSISNMTFAKDCKVYDTINLTNNCAGLIEYNEYLVASNNDLLEFDYVYDCNLDSPIKRYTKYYTEYIKQPIDNFNHFIRITNYYGSPKVYTAYDIENKVEFVYIGRRATKTQTKQEDIIAYMLNENRR